MKVYQTQQAVENDIKDGVLAIESDVKFECSISINASIVVKGSINAGDINAWSINAGNIHAGDINAWNINAGNINAWNINAWDINAWNINAWDINAWNINAMDIYYYAFCCVYESIKCLSIKSRRSTAKEPICLDGRVEILQNEKKLKRKLKK